MKQSESLPEKLNQVLSEYSPCHDYMVAYSGGMDSHVLLHCMAILAREQSLKLRAIHINHGLSPYADDWETHCAEVCHTLSVEMVASRITVTTTSDEGPESAARLARYAAISRQLGRDQVLLTAHHRQDQAETFILQLMRGSGISGLTAMSMLRPLPPGWLLRPFLHIGQDVLADYAVQHELDWIRDPSNEDTRYNRNYVRHRVLPVMLERWPAVVNVIDRCSRYLSEASTLADMLAEYDLDNVHSDDVRILDLNAYTALPFIRRKNLLRFWIKSYCGSVPPSTELEQIARVLAEASRDANPLLEWNNIQIRRYRERVYILPALPPCPGTLQLDWDLSSPLRLPLGVLKACRVDPGTGNAPAGTHGKRITVRFRYGGEKIRPAGRGHTHSVKNLLQEAGMPPWLREYLPMLYIDDKLALIPGICLGVDFPSELADMISAVVWELPDDILPGHFSKFKTDINLS